MMGRLINHVAIEEGNLSVIAAEIKRTNQLLEAILEQLKRDGQRI